MRFRSSLACVALSVLSILAVPAAASGATTLPAGFREDLLAGYTYATALDFTADGRILLAAQTGQLRIFEDGHMLPGPALDISNRICTDGERGLLGVAADPADEHAVYLYYTSKGATSCGADPAVPSNTPVNRVSRFTLGHNDLVDPASEQVLIDNIPNMAGIHNGGDLAFGKDGNLFISVGDGGCDYAVPFRGCGPGNPAARDRNVLVGKILRITPDGGIPADNPYLGSNTARCNQTGKAASGTWCREIFAMGLRNPFRMAFDPNAAGVRFFINDVGVDLWEEVDEGQAGADYGWNLREGPCANGSSVDCGPPPTGITDPVYSYSHSGGCSAITGGAFVPNDAWPSEYDGTYLYSELVCDKIVQLVPSSTGGYTGVNFATNLKTPIAIKFGPYGSGHALYYVTWGAPPGLYRISYTSDANRPPDAVAGASPVAGDLPLTVNFDAGGSSDPDSPDLVYDWDFGDGSQGSGVTDSHTYAVAGTYTAKLTVIDDGGEADTDTVRIDAGNNFPDPVIESPTASDKFSVGQDITLNGTASDPEDGPLPASALTWTVVKHHATHTHPFLAPTAGDGVHITAPQPEDFSATTNTYLEIILTATDSQGLTKTVTRDLRPDLVNVAFGTDPPGLRLELNGLAPPAAGTAWKGWQLNLSAPSPQVSAARLHSFSSWSDGGAQSHVITMNGDTTYTARYVPSGYARPKGGTLVDVALVPAFQACSTLNRAHAPPLAFSSCSPPTQASAFATLGSPNGTGTTFASVGHVRFTTMTGNTSTPADEADVNLSASLTDVFARSTSSDYTGSLEIVTKLRLTDRLNGGSDPGSVTDFALHLRMPCATTGTTAGSTCSAATTADALIPGIVVEGKRSVWQLDKVEVFDGGPDGDVATPDNTLFATQGVFVP
jgi:glucose/arabinose dehydrogenase/PKD repeat protein